MADIGPLGRPLVAADSYPSTCCRSSVVEHSIGNGEVDSSILSGSTIPWVKSRTDQHSRGSKRPSFASPYPSSVERAQGRPGAGWHPRSAARRCSAKRPHSSIQVTPNTRPSLRSGLTAYAALSPATSSFLSPSPCELTMDKDPVESRSISARLDRSNDGQDHTILPYAAIRLCQEASPDTSCFAQKGFAGRWRPVVRTLDKTSRGSSRPGPVFVPDAAASTTPRSTFVTTDDRPSPWTGMAD